MPALAPVTRHVFPERSARTGSVMVRPSGARSSAYPGLSALVADHVLEPVVVERERLGQALDEADDPEGPQAAADLEVVEGGVRAQ